MNLLAIDTSTDTLFVAVQRGDAIWQHSGPGAQQSSAQLLPAIRQLMKDAGLSFAQLDAIAFGRGPGSFTGLRTACAITQGLAFAAKVPVLPVDSLLTVAEEARHLHGCTEVEAVLDARMGEVYWAEYQRDAQGVWHGEETEAVLKPEAVTERLKQLSGEWAMVGTGWPAWPDMANDTGLTLVEGNMLLPAAEDMLPIACQLLAAGKTVAVEHAEPVYLRNTVAWKKLPGRE